MDEAYGEYDEIGDWIIWDEPDEVASGPRDALEEDEDELKYEGYEFTFGNVQGEPDASQQDYSQQQTYEENGEEVGPKGYEQQDPQEVQGRRAHFEERWTDEDFPEFEESALYPANWGYDADSRSVRMSNARLQLQRVTPLSGSLTSQPGAQGALTSRSPRSHSELQDVLQQLSEMVRFNMLRLSGPNSGARSQSVPRVVKTNAGSYQYEEPLREVKYDVGFKCMIPVVIGGKQFRMCVDTGAGKSMIQKEFREKIQQNAHTKSGILERRRIKGDVHCTGICADMSSNRTEHETVLELALDPVSEDGSKPPPRTFLTLEMGELSGASDFLLVGFPDIVRLDVRFFEDPDRNVWVEFNSLGISVLVETPARPGS